MLRRMFLTAFFYQNRHYVYNLLTWNKQVAWLFRVIYTCRTKFVPRPVQMGLFLPNPYRKPAINMLNK